MLRGIIDKRTKREHNKFMNTGNIKKTFVEVRFHPVRKNLDLGPVEVFLARQHPGETPYHAAERALERRYKVRDYLIRDAKPMARLH